MSTCLRAVFTHDHQIVLDVFYCRHALWAGYNTPFEHLHA